MKNLEILEPGVSVKVWGGDKLSKLKNINKSKIGETWEVSTHKDSSSLIKGKQLSDTYDLSYLVKFIDTSDHLSIQVHPGDSYAEKYENSLGKTECWIILDTLPSAGIFLGFKPDVDKLEFYRAVKKNEDVTRFLNFIEVEKGDFFFLPPGSIHAIGKGITLCEVQQSSGVTYRVWDWNRLGLDGKPRELHIDKAMDVLNFDNKFNENLISGSGKESLSMNGILAKHDCFEVEIISLARGESCYRELLAGNSIVSLRGKLECIDEYQSYFCTDLSTIHLRAKEDSTLIIVR